LILNKKKITLLLNGSRASISGRAPNFWDRTLHEGLALHR